MKNPFRRRPSPGGGLEELQLDRYQQRVEQIQETVLGELERLTDARAVDSAHATVLDSFISERFAPLYGDANNRFLQGIRQLEDRQKRLKRKFDRAQHHALLAADRQHVAQTEADRAYAIYVGQERPHPKRTELSPELVSEPSFLNLRGFLGQHRAGGFRGDTPAFLTSEDPHENETSNDHE